MSINRKVVPLTVAKANKLYNKAPGNFDSEKLKWVQAQLDKEGIKCSTTTIRRRAIEGHVPQPRGRKLGVKVGSYDKKTQLPSIVVLNGIKYKRIN